MRRGPQTIFLIFLIALLVGGAVMMQRFWKPAVLALITAMVLQPYYLRIEQWLRGRRYLAAAVAVCATCGLITIPLGGIVATITMEVIHFSQNLSDHLQQGQLAASLDAISQWVKGLVLPFTGPFQEDFDLRAMAIDAVKELAQGLYQFSPRVITKTANFGFNVVLWLLFLFVFFADGARLYAYVLETAPIIPHHERQISKGLRGMVSAVFLGMIATSAANALLMGIAFAVCGIERPLVWALITFGFSFIPIVGAFSIWAGGAAYLLLIGEWHFAVGLALFGTIIIAQADNIIKPLVMRGRVNVHPVLLLLSILGGIQALGPAGLLFGPVFVAILLEALQIYREEYAQG